MLRERRLLWPLVLFRYNIEHSHTKTFTGTEWLDGIKGGLSLSSLELTDEALIVTGLVLRRRHLSISLGEIEDVGLFENRPGLIDVRFREAEWGTLARFATSGKPGGDRKRVILNVHDHAAWLDEIESRIE